MLDIAIGKDGDGGDARTPGANLEDSSTAGGRDQPRRRQTCHRHEHGNGGVIRMWRIPSGRPTATWTLADAGTLRLTIVVRSRQPPDRRRSRCAFAVGSADDAWPHSDS